MRIRFGQPRVRPRLEGEEEHLTSRTPRVPTSTAQPSRAARVKRLPLDARENDGNRLSR